MKQAALSIGALLLALAPSRAEDASTLQLHRAYGTEHGLPSNWIHALVQTRDGYLWVGTHNGLARFDGTRFTVFHALNTPELPGNNVRALHEGRDGSLWIGTTVGLVRCRAAGSGAFEAIEELDGRGILTLFEDHAGTLWVGSNEGLWSSADGASFRAVEDSPTLVRAIAEDGAGTLWFGSDLGLFELQSGRFERTAEEWLPDSPSSSALLPRSGVRTLHQDREGLWIGTNQGLLRYSQGRFEYQEQGIGRTRLHAVVRSRDGTLFVGGRHGLYRSGGEAFASLPTRENVECLLEDREGGLWVGFGAGGGLHRYKSAGVSGILTDRLVHCVQEARDGTIWFGSDDGLHHLVEGTLTEYGLDHGLPGLPVKTIALGSGDTLWIGTARGLARWADGELTPLDSPPELAGMHLRATYEDASGVLWLAPRRKGLYSLENGRLAEVSELSQGATKWFHEDDRGRLWLGHDDGLFRRTEAGFERVRDSELDRLPSNFFCHYSGGDGDLWLGTGAGIARLRSGRFDSVTIRDGLAAAYIDRMHADNNGNLWLGGRHGYFYVELQELNDFVAGRIPGIVSHAIEPDFGMSQIAGSSGFPNSCRTTDGTLWICAGGGAMRVPPEPLVKNLVPLQVHIESVELDGRAIEADDHFELLSGPHRITIAFATPSFSAPGRVRARYRLDGYDEDWIEAGAERIVHYTDLPPGDYSFRVVAENEDGLVNAEGRTLGFHVRPRWWEVTWLRVCALFAFLAASGLYLRLRTRRMKARNTELKREIADRKRAEEEARQHWDQLGRVSRAASMGELTTSIAHEIKQPLFAIVSNAQTVRRLLQREEPDRAEVLEALEDIASDGNRASDIIDHIHSMVRKEHGPLEELDLNEVAREAIRLVDPEIRRRGLTLRVDLADELPGVKGDPIELQQVLINLIVNGAQAMEDVEIGALTVGTSATNGWVTLAVEDQGMGLDEEHTKRLFEPFYTTKPRGTGMGLAINRSIIERHGGKIWATPNEGPGATFEFSLQTNGNAS